MSAKLNMVQIWDVYRTCCQSILKDDLNEQIDNCDDEFDDESNADVINLCLTPDGRRVIAGYYDGKIRIWDIEASTCTNVIDGMCNGVICVTPDGEKLISGDQSERIIIRDTEKFSIIGGMNIHVQGLSVAPDGQTLVSWSTDGKVYLWSLETYKCFRAFDAKALNVDITSDGKNIAVYGWDGKLRVWELATEKLIMSCTVKNLSSNIIVNGLNIIAGDDYGQVQFYQFENYSSGTPICTATRIWLYQKHSWDKNLTIKCPWCGEKIAVYDEWLGLKINCPLPECNRPIMINAFIGNKEDRIEGLD